MVFLEKKIDFVFFSEKNPAFSLKWPPIGHPPIAGVRPIGRIFFSPMPSQWSPKKGNNFGQKKSTLTEIFDPFPKKLSRFGSEISLWVDFFGPTFFPFMAHRWVESWVQDRFWTSSTPAEKSGAKVRRKIPLLSDHAPPRV
jgi:hypothetical protein